MQTQSISMRIIVSVFFFFLSNVCNCIDQKVKQSWKPASQNIQA